MSKIPTSDPRHFESSDPIHLEHDQHRTYATNQMRNRLEDRDEDLPLPDIDRQIEEERQAERKYLPYHHRPVRVTASEKRLNSPRTDDGIKDDLARRLAQLPEFGDSKIEIQVRSGEVELNGRVPTQKEWFRATDLAETVPGVRTVCNKMTYKN